jgi:outer membrane protein OmpA-like peptidoglycan-associated protein
MKRSVAHLALVFLLPASLALAADPSPSPDMTARWGFGGQLGFQKPMGGERDYANVDHAATIWLRRGIKPNWSLDAGLHYGYNRLGALQGQDAGFTFDGVLPYYSTTFHAMAGPRWRASSRGPIAPYVGVYGGVLDWHVIDMDGITGFGIFPDGPIAVGYGSDGARHKLQDRVLTGTIDVGAEWSLGRVVAFNAGLRWTRLLGNKLDNVGSSAEWGADEADINSQLFEAYGGMTLYFGGNDDKDKDGIRNDDDLCPVAAEDRDGWQDTDGCPDLDNDNDGIADTKDACPNDAEDRDGFRDDDGCPDADNDADGVIDARDKCPNELEDRDGWQDDDGCPDPDNDGDGVLDAADKCPDTAAGTTVDANGCVEVVELKASMVLKGVSFKPASAVLEPSSATVLDQIVATLNAWPFARVEIQGHTDDNGSAEANRQLSTLRAEAVRAYLVKAGIDGKRLSAVGYGEDLPVADNTTEAGRALNRRVEMVRTDR